MTVAHRNASSSSTHNSIRSKFEARRSNESRRRSIRSSFRHHFFIVVVYWASRVSPGNQLTDEHVLKYGKPDRPNLWGFKFAFPKHKKAKPKAVREQIDNNWVTGRSALTPQPPWNALMCLAIRACYPIEMYKFKRLFQL